MYAGVIVAPNSSEVIVSSNEISGMTLSNPGNDSPLAYGILTYGIGFDNMPSNLIFENNNIYGIAGSAISLGAYTTDIIIKNNNLHDIIPVEYLGEYLSVGVQTQFGQNVSVTDNVFSNLVIGSNLLLSSGTVTDNSYNNVASLL
jgi:hypothetical protein